jgi:hypothetical protein
MSQSSMKLSVLLQGLPHLAKPGPGEGGIAMLVAAEVIFRRYRGRSR